MKDYLIRAKVDTVLKRFPLDSSQLPDEQKQSISQGTEIHALSYAIADNHITFFSMQDGFLGKWYAFGEHVQVLEGGVDLLAAKELVTQAQAEYVFGNKIFDNELADLNKCLITFGITEKEDIRMFLAQCSHESGGLRYLKEIASGDDYEWRDDLGNNQAGDGRKYKGVSPLQMTGRLNYQAFADYIEDPNVMEGVEYVASKYIFAPSGFWWANNEISEYIANGATIEQVSTRVNGANPANGLSDRIYYYQRACDVI